MANRFAFLTAAVLISSCVLAQEGPALKTQKEKISYALGMDLGNQFRKQGVEIDPDIFVMALKEVIAGAKTRMTEEEGRAAIAALQKETKSRMIEKNRKDGEAFLVANKKKEGVVALPSGLQYKILKAGTGAKPGVMETVVCHYRGTLIDGTEFDSSYKRNEPAKFPVNGVIKGWTEALQLMPAGSKWQLFIPWALAYGENGAGSVIPPYSTLIFEVELLSIQKK